MSFSERLVASREDFRRIVEGHRAKNPRVFAADLRGDAPEQSGDELTVVVEPMPGATLFDLAAIEVELAALLGVKVAVTSILGWKEEYQKRELEKMVVL